jgi:hypothetical protein
MMVWGEVRNILKDIRLVGEWERKRQKQTLKAMTT